VYGENGDGSGDNDDFGGKYLLKINKVTPGL